MAVINSKLSTIIKKLKAAKKEANDRSAAVKAQTGTAEEYGVKADDEAKRILQMKLQERLEAKDGNFIFGYYPQTRTGHDATPIEWQVLQVQNDSILLLSRYGLDAQPYNTENVNTNWEKSSLRRWLNKDFLNAAFTAVEQEIIQTTDADNSMKWNNGFDIDAGSNTQDKVFLLSDAEVEKYFQVVDYSESGVNNNTKSRTSPTDYAKAQGACTSSSYKTADGAAACQWWLRSIGLNPENASLVFGDGSRVVSHVDSGYNCVRPALWIKLGI